MDEDQFLAIQKISFKNESFSESIKNIKFIMWQNDFKNLTPYEIHSKTTLEIESHEEMAKILQNRGLTRSVLLWKDDTSENISITADLECCSLQIGFLILKNS